MLNPLQGLFELQVQKAQADFHHVDGEFKTMTELSQHKPQNDLYKKSMIKKQHELNDALTTLVRTEAALNLTQHFLDTVDTAEVDTNIKSQLIKIVSDKDTAEAIEEHFEEMRAK